MKDLIGVCRVLRATGRAALASALCGWMIGQPLLAEAAVAPSPAQLAGNERILHALDRFTFGPRPGDVAAVRAMGLKRWFERQLNPSSIDDSDLEARLAQYPAMNLSIEQLETWYPGPQEIRRIVAGKASLPKDPAERAMVADQVAFYKMQKAKQEAKAADLAPANPNSIAGDVSVQASQKMDDAAGGGQRITAPEGFSHEEAMAIIALPPDSRFQTVMAMNPADLIRFRQSLRPIEQAQLAAGLAPAQRETLEALASSARMVSLEAMESRVERDVYSNRQMEAVMTDFWLNHFNVYLRKNQQEPFLIPTYERDTIRANALGNFEKLLVETAMSPAMLEYLDNARSIGPNSPAAMRVKRIQQLRPDGPLAKAASAGLNENYGRELMELHTLGVNGGYTQADVTNVAKVFTGWTIDKDTQQFVFDERRHEPGAKIVLGRTIPEDGVNEGLAVLHMLATSPATARFISQKLAVRFVGDTPPPALVDRMAAAFLSSHGDIRQVLIAMWNSPEFWSPDVYRAKVKTPEEFVISAVRASGVQVSNPAALAAAIGKLGMPLYGMQTPNGYGWKEADWVNTGALVSRMNFSLVLSTGRLPGTEVSWSGTLVPARAGVKSAAYSGSDELAAKERRLEALLLGAPVSERTRAAVLAQAGDTGMTDQAETQFDLRGNGVRGGNVYRKKGFGENGAVAADFSDDSQAAVMAGLLLGSPEFQRR
jgi:uncharacterized protein (DUF1800 family)